MTPGAYTWFKHFFMKQSIIFPLLAAGLLAMPQLTHASASAGDLVVCDGNSSVYLVADDGKRYVFPNESIYSTHFSDFDDVETIPCAELGELPLGGIVKYRHGSTLVKIQSSETVYAVAHGGKLLPIPSEEVAIALYGPDWARLVVDIPSSFFSFFEKGEAVQEDELPEGMLLEDEDGVLLEVNEDGDAFEVEDLVESTQNRDQLDRIARPLSEIEERLNKQIRIRNLVEEALESGDDSELDALLALLEPVAVPRERRAAEEVRVNDGTVSARDAQKELNKAVRELERAEQKILKREEQGKDVSTANDLLAEAGSLYNQARAAFDAGDFAAAEELAEEARDKAKEARMGWAVSDDDDAEDLEDEDLDEDESEDEDLADEEEDTNEDTEEDLDEDEEDVDEDLDEEDMDDEDIDEDEDEEEREDESDDDEE